TDRPSRLTAGAEQRDGEGDLVPHPREWPLLSEHEQRFAVLVPLRGEHVLHHAGWLVVRLLQEEAVVLNRTVLRTGRSCGVDSQREQRERCGLRAHAGSQSSSEASSSPTIWGPSPVARVIGPPNGSRAVTCTCAPGCRPRSAT